MATVVALKNEGSMGAAKGDGRVNAGGYARAFEDDVGTVGGDVADSFVCIRAVNEVVGAEFLCDVEAVGFQVYGDDFTTPVAACSDDAQADETTAIYDNAVAHPGVGHIYAVEAHGGHDK